MYKAFYNLKRNPFDITPDPSFLFATKHHNEALASLYYGVKRRKGFVVLTGEVGTGKTLLVRCLLQILSLANVSYAYVFNPRLSSQEFLQYIAGDFGLSTAGKSKSELLLDISTYVIGRHQRNGATTVLVVDEAHHLSGDLLEEIRLLTNLETPEHKLLQILLVGQPELDYTLDSVALRQLKQRIALRAHLAPLNLEESEGYIHRRLKQAGHSSPTTLFPRETVVELHRVSRGFPRLINTICENALIQGYACQARVITPEIVEDIAADFRLQVEHSTVLGEKPQPSDRAREVQQAALTLLNLYNQLRVGQETSPNVPSADKPRQVDSGDPLSNMSPAPNAGISSRRVASRQEGAGSKPRPRKHLGNDSRSASKVAFLQRAGDRQRVLTPDSDQPDLLDVTLTPHVLTPSQKLDVSAKEDEGANPLATKEIQ